MYVDRLLLQLAIFAASCVQIYCVLSLPDHLLNNHSYRVAGEMSLHDGYKISIDQIYFEKCNAWYRLYSDGENLPHLRRYFLPWEVKFLQMHSGNVTFEVSGLVGELTMLITCQFRNLAQFQDFHHEVYLDRVTAYSSEENDAKERFETWQVALPTASTRKLKWPKSLKLMYDDLEGLVKIKKYDPQTDGDTFTQPQLIAGMNDKVHIFYEDHEGKVDKKPKETYTIFTVPWVKAESRYVPEVQLIFGTDNFKIVDKYMYWKIVILMGSEYYVLCFPRTANMPKALRYFKEIAEYEIPMPPEIEFFIKDLPV